MNTSVLVPPPSKEHRGSKKRGRTGRARLAPPTVADSEPDERLHPVACDLCDTEMGVVSAADEVYTFFNVVPSTA